MTADMVDLPLCRLQLRRTLSAEDRTKSSCHASGTIPSFSVKATRSRASLRSSLSATITRTFYGPQDGSSCVCVGLQGSYYHGPELQPLRGDEDVYRGPVVQFAEQL